MLNYAGVVKSKDAEQESRRLAASEFPAPRPHAPLSNKDRRWVLEIILDALDEGGAVGAVDHAVVE
jgi:hypothetical protein